MPITTLAVTSLDANWTLGAGANRTVAVAQPDDDDTSYITDSANAATTFSVADPVSLGSIGDVTVHVYGRTTLGGPTLSVSVSTDGWSTSSATTIGLSGTGYREQDAQFLLNPAGTAWSTGDIANLQVRIQGVSELTTWRVSTIRVSVEWSSAAFMSRGGRMLAGFEDII